MMILKNSLLRAIFNLVLVNQVIMSDNETCIDFLMKL